jgi:PAS domain-containing protein
MASATKSSRELQLEAEVDRLRGFVDEATRGANQAHALARDQYDQFERVSESLIRSGEFLRRVLAGSGDCIKVLDLDTRLQFMNTGGLVVMEIVEFEPFVGCPWLEFWTGQFETAARAAVETAKNGQVGRFQGFCATAKGTPKWWDVQVLPLVGLDGKPEQLLSISTDITERKRAEDHQRVLMQELEHRVKNTLALVQSIANQTFRDGPAMAEARETFAARLHALTEAHDLLIQTSWGSANIAAVVASVIAPHIDDQQTRFRIDGRG